MLDLFGITEFIDQFLIPKTQDNRFVHMGMPNIPTVFPSTTCHTVYDIISCSEGVEQLLRWHTIWVQFPELLLCFRLVAEGLIVYSNYCDQCIRTQFSDAWIADQVIYEVGGQTRIYSIRSHVWSFSDWTATTEQGLRFITIRSRFRCLFTRRMVGR